MTRRAYLNERQQIYRWRSQLETALARVDELLAKRPTGENAKYGYLPALPDAIFDHWAESWIRECSELDQSV